MTTFIIFSDVHAILPAMVALQTQAHTLVPIFLGDIIGYGVHPVQTANRVMSWVLDKQGIALAGNHDAVAQGIAIPQSPEAIALDREHGNRLKHSASDTYEWLTTLKPQGEWQGMDGFYLAHDTFYASNGTIQNRAWGYATQTPLSATNQVENMLEMDNSFRFLAVGHYHVPFLGKYDREQKKVIPVESVWQAQKHVINVQETPLLLNVGSISLPRAGSKASYVLLEQDSAQPDQITIEFKELRFKHNKVRDEIESYPESLKTTILEQLNGVEEPNA